MHVAWYHRPARHVETLPNTVGHDIGLFACELALACIGLLCHNSMTTWRQLPGSADANDETCRPIYCLPSAIVQPIASQTELDRISAQSSDRSSVGRISDGIMHVFRTFHRHTGILNNVASRRVASRPIWFRFYLIADVDASGTTARA